MLLLNSQVNELQYYPFISVGCSAYREGLRVSDILWNRDPGGLPIVGW